MDKLTTKDKNTYEDFCNSISRYHLELNNLVMKEWRKYAFRPGKLKEKWGAKCAGAKLVIYTNRENIVQKLPNPTSSPHP